MYAVLDVWSNHSYSGMVSMVLRAYRIARGSEQGLCFFNECILIVSIPIWLLEKRIILESWDCHPVMLALIGLTMLITVPYSFKGVINCFFSMQNDSKD